MSIKQISVFLENQPGTLLSMTGVLAEHRIDMRALSLAETNDFGIVRLIVDDPYEAANVLKEAEFIFNVTPVVGVMIPDAPGGLDQVLEVLGRAEVNVEYMYAFLGGKNVNHAYMIFRVENEQVATSALRTAGIQVVDQEDIIRL